MKRFVLLLILALLPIAGSPQNKTKKPIVLKLIEKPAQLRIGQSYRFVFDIINISPKPVTLSSICNASVSLTWKNRDGTVGDNRMGCFRSTTVIEHAYDPRTDEITAGSRIVPYTRDSFFTLEPNSAKRFQTELTVPKDIKPRWVTVHLDFDSSHDGSLVGIVAWTGVISYDLRMFVRN